MFVIDPAGLRGDLPPCVALAIIEIKHAPHFRVLDAVDPLVYLLCPLLSFPVAVKACACDPHGLLSGDPAAVPDLHDAVLLSIPWDLSKATLNFCYINVHLDVINTAIDTSAHWLLDVVAADQCHEFLTCVCLLIFALNCGLHESVHGLIPVYGFRPDRVMFRAQVDDKAMLFADPAQTLAEESMMFVDCSVDCIIAKCADA